MRRTLGLVLLLSACGLRAQEAPFDLLIRGGRVVDGTGAPWFRADVGVRDGRIAAVGMLVGRPAKPEIDALITTEPPGGDWASI